MFLSLDGIAHRLAPSDANRCAGQNRIAWRMATLLRVPREAMRDSIGNSGRWFMPDDNFKNLAASYNIDPEALEERAGIVEYDAGLSREVAEAAALVQMIRQRDCRRLIDLLFAPNDLIELRSFPLKDMPGAPVSKWTRAVEFENLLDLLGKLNGEGFGCYIGILPRRREGGSKDSDATPGRVVWTDIDNTTPADAKRRLQASRLPAPAAVVGSGHGIHFYWRLTGHHAPVELSQAVVRVASAIGGDKAVRNPSRVMRFLGFVNHKPPSAWCTLLAYRPGWIVSLAELLAHCPEPANSPPTAAPRRNPRLHWTAADSRAPRDRVAAAMRYCAKIPAVVEGARNAQAFKVAAAALKDWDLDAPAAWNVLTTWNQGNHPPLSDGELVTVLRDADRYGKHVLGRLAHQLPRPPADAANKAISAPVAAR